MWARKRLGSGVLMQQARQYWGVPGAGCGVTDHDLGATKWVGINQPVRLMDELAAMPEHVARDGHATDAVAAGRSADEQVIRIDNDIADMDIDVTIEEGIGVRRIGGLEQFQILHSTCRDAAGLIPPEILIAASSLRNKDQLLEQLKEHQQQHAQQQQQVAQMAQQKAQADTAATQAKAAADFALGQRNASTRRCITSPSTHAMFNQTLSAPPGSAVRSGDSGCRFRGPGGHGFANRSRVACQGTSRRGAGERPAA